MLKGDSGSWYGANASPLPLTPSSKGSRGGSRQHLPCGSRVAVWLASSLPAATACRPSPVCPPRPFFPNHQRKWEDGAPRCGDRWRAGPGSAQHTQQRVLNFCFYCTAWLRSCALSSGHEANASEMQTQDLLCARLQKGRRVVVWLVLIYVLMFKLFHDRARQRLRLLKKAYGVWTLGVLQSPGLLPLKFKCPPITLSPVRTPA